MAMTAFISRQEYVHLFNMFKKALNVGTYKRARIITSNQLEESYVQDILTEKVEKARLKIHSKINANDRIDAQQKERLVSVVDLVIERVVDHVYDGELTSFASVDVFVNDSYGYLTR